LRSDITFMIEKEVERVMNSYIAPGMNPDEYIQEDLVSMVREIHSVMPQLSALEVKDVVGMKYENMYDKIKDMALDAYKHHEQQMVDFYNNVVSQYEPSFQAEVPFTDKNIMRQLERDILLRVVDTKWIDHLNNIDMLRDGIGLRAYGQKNPLLEYKKEAYELFNKMMFEIQSETVQHLFRTKFGVQVVEPQGNSINYKSPIERNENV